MHLPALEEVLSQLILQEDTERMAHRCRSNKLKQIEDVDLAGIRDCVSRSSFVPSFSLFVMCRFVEPAATVRSESRGGIPQSVWLIQLCSLIFNIRDVQSPGERATRVRSSPDVRLHFCYS
jgi:hypothetical protein